MTSFPEFAVKSCPLATAPLCFHSTGDEIRPPSLVTAASWEPTDAGCHALLGLLINLRLSIPLRLALCSWVLPIPVPDIVCIASVKLLNAGT